MKMKKDDTKAIDKLKETMSNVEKELNEMSKTYNVEIFINKIEQYDVIKGNETFTYKLTARTIPFEIKTDEEEVEEEDVEEESGE